MERIFFCKFVQTQNIMASFFKPRKNKQFSYTPRYYSERKERLDNLKQQQSGEETTAEQRIRGKIKRASATTTPGLFSGATLRTFAILGVLIVVIYYFLKKLSLDF